jgi:hypothetical protein
VAVPEPQAAPDPHEEAAIEEAAEEPIIATIAAVPGRTAAPPPPGTYSYAALAASITDADRAQPPANEPPQARSAAREEAAEADLTKGRERTHAASSEAPKRNHRAAAHARKRSAGAHRAHQATPAPTPNQTYNFFGQNSFQSHF